MIDKIFFKNYYNIITNYIISRNFKVNIKKTALHSAVIKGNLEIIQLLLNRKDIDINIKDNNVYFV